MISLLLIAMMPVMHEIFYERSRVWMHQLKPYQKEEITSLMQALSVIGDGEPYAFFGFLTTYARGKQYDFVYLTFALFATNHWLNILKQGFRYGRP